MPDPARALEGRREELKGALLSGMSAADPEWWAGRFADLANAVFRYQAAANPVYGRFVRDRGVDPDGDVSLDDIPAVPARGFKDVALMCGDPSQAERVFETSGTTRRGARGRHYVRDLSLYRASLLSAARPMVGPDNQRKPGDQALNRTNIRVLSLVPNPSSRPDSSLAYMIGCWVDAWGDGADGFFADPDWRIDVDGFRRALLEASTDDIPTLLVGTAFSFVHLLDWAEHEHDLAPLPAGSIVVETGGFKGRSRTLDRGDFYGALSARLAIPVGRIVNEYGMTELLSQFYEPVLREEAPADPAGRWHVGPPWVRTTILDPRTLAPLSTGQTGLLCHLDLANLDSVSRVLTEDMGVAVEGGFRLLGRSAGSEPRGCSLAADALISAAGASATNPSAAAEPASGRAIDDPAADAPARTSEP